MNKRQLKTELKAIQDQYEPVEEKNNDLLKHSYLEPYVQCLNHPDLEQHLLKSGLRKPDDNMANKLKYFGDGEGIVEAFEYDLSQLAEDGLIISKEQKLQNLLDEKYQRNITKSLINNPSSNVSMALNGLYGKVKFNDGKGCEVKGLSEFAINEVMSHVNYLDRFGDN